MEIARHWRSQADRYNLPGDGRGEVYSYTTVYEAPENYAVYAPYTIALIRLTNGRLITAQLTDVENRNVYIGMPVEMVTRKLKENGKRGIIVYGYKFRPPVCYTPNL